MLPSWCQRHGYHPLVSFLAYHSVQTQLPLFLMLHYAFHFTADHPSHSCGHVGPCILRPVDIDCRISTFKDDRFLAFSANLGQAQDILIEFLGCFQILDRNICSRTSLLPNISILLPSLFVCRLFTLHSR